MRFLTGFLSSRRKSAALVIVIALAIASGAVARMLAQSAPVSYPPALEGQLWKQMLPWGLNKDADGNTIWPTRQDLNNTPSPLREDRGWVELTYNDIVYGSVRIDDPRWAGRPDAYGRHEADAVLAAQLQFEHLTAVGQCTFSHADDYDIGWWVYFPQVRYCMGPNGEKLPPAPGKLLNPAGIALSKSKVYVSDLFNHRIQVFDFYGNVQPVQFPIGNGVPGTGFYNYDTEYPGLNYRPYGGSFNGGYSGHQLSAPYGIALDAHQVLGVAAPHLLVADSGNNRVAIFNEDGSNAFGPQNAPIHATLTTPLNTVVGHPQYGQPLSAEQFKPDLVAVSPNAVVLAPGTVIADEDPNKNERIVITDRQHCYVQIVDAAFNPIKSMPLANPVVSQHHGCKEGENGAATLPYEFSTVTGVQIDANGNIFIADHAQNVVQVFDRDGVFLAFIGKPGQNNPGGSGNLRGPVGLLIDDLGRLGVVDGGNARAVFYDISAGPAQAKYEFQIGVTVSIEDFPMGLAFQVGPATDSGGAPTGLDPKGRILVTDPLRRRLLRFELPEIVIANAKADITLPDLDPKEGIGSFDVVVPWQKRSAVNDVIVTITPQVPGQVHVKPGSVVPSLSSRPDILNGQMLHYTFEFTSEIPEVKFDITARGDCDANGNNCLAKEVQAPAIARALCVGCAAAHEVYEDPEGPLGPVEAFPIDTDDQTITDDETLVDRLVEGWYDREVFVRIHPANPPGTAQDDPNRVAAIEWSYGGVSGDLVGTFTSVVETPYDETFVDVPVRIGDLSWVTYRAITNNGSASEPVEVLLPLDLTEPTIRFIDWTPRTGTDGLRDWHNQATVTGTYEVVDPESGPAVPVTATVNFTAETVDQFDTFTVFDQVGHSAVRNSVQATLGRHIHIDRHPPIFYDEGALTFNVSMTGAVGSQRFATLGLGAFRIEAFDPVLPGGQPGSRTPFGRFPVDSPAGQYFDGDTITFTATDFAGNTSTKTATIRVGKIVPTITLTGGTFTYDGITHPASCQVTGVSGVPATGVLTYLPGNTSLPINAGNYTATCSFGGDDNYEAATPVSAPVLINPKLATLIAGSNSKVFNNGADTTIAVTHSGILAQDIPTITFASSRVAGQNVGSYVTSATATGGNAGNYDFTVQPGSFTITPATVTVTPLDAFKIYGAADPTTFAKTFSSFPSGYSQANVTGVTCGLTAANVNAGIYANTITCTGPASIDPNVLLTYGSATFTILKRNATITANSVQRFFTVDNPTLTAAVVIDSSDGTITGDTLIYNVSTTAVRSSQVNDYPITVTVNPGDNPNYNVTPAPGTLKVLKLKIALTANFATKVYGFANPSLSATAAFVPANTPANYAVTTPGDYTVTTTAVLNSPVNLLGYPVTVVPGNNPNLDITVFPNVMTVTPRLITVTADAKEKFVGEADPAFTYQVTSGSLFAPADLSGSLTRVLGVELPGVYPILQGTLNVTSNYVMVYVPAFLTIKLGSANHPPVAGDDSATTVGAAPVTIPVFANDSDPDTGDTLTITSPTFPLSVTGGTFTLSGSSVVFTPTPGFIGTATFTYTVSDGHGGTDTGTVTVTVTAPPTCTLTGFTTYTQGGWGANPNGNNPAMLLQNKFAQVYPGGSVSIGGTKKLTFTSSTAIKNFLPAGGTAGVLNANATNPTSSSAGVFAGQMLAMQLNLDFSNAGVTKAGLAYLMYEGYSVADIMAAANAVLGGDTSILTAYGITVAELSAIIDSFNQNFDNGTVNLGVLSCPPAATNCGPTQISTTGNSATSGAVGNLRTFTGGNVSVKASAFSRTKSSGAWSPAYLGAFSVGLGVTDGSEGTGADDSHKVDNIGDRLNYLLFEFSQPVVVTKAFLDYIGADGDVTVWVGTKSDPFNNHQTLSDAFLTSLGAAQSNTSTTTADRWATFNGANVTANVLVIAADVTDTTPEDAFKISKLEFSCASVPNQAPVVTTVTNKTNLEGDVVSVQVAANDPDNDTLTYSATTPLPQGLTLNSSTGLISGTLSYTAAATYNVTIRVDDSDGASATTAFVWTVTNTNRAPTITAANRTDAEGNTVGVQFTGSDPDGDALTYSATGLPTGLTIAASGATAGKVTGTLGYSASATYNVTITTKDPGNKTGSAAFVWTVINTNRPPDAVNDAVTVFKGESVFVSVLANDTDPDGGTPTILSKTDPSKGSVSIQSNGTIKYTAPTNWTGTTTFTYTIKDASGATDTATVTVTVKAHTSGDGCNNHS